jgi:site-specific DNA recombinase
MVGEIKKGKYVYYHCAGYKGKCPEPYVREEVFDEKFSALLARLHFCEEVHQWIVQGLRTSLEDERKEHDTAVSRLQAEYGRLTQYHVR